MTTKVRGSVGWLDIAAPEGVPGKVLGAKADLVFKDIVGQTDPAGETKFIRNAANTAWISLDYFSPVRQPVPILQNWYPEWNATTSTSDVMSIPEGAIIGDLLVFFVVCENATNPNITSTEITDSGGVVHTDYTTPYTAAVLMVIHDGEAGSGYTVNFAAPGSWKHCGWAVQRATAPALIPPPIFTPQPSGSTPNIIANGGPAPAGSLALALFASGDGTAVPVTAVDDNFWLAAGVDGVPEINEQMWSMAKSMPLAGDTGVATLATRIPSLPYAMGVQVIIPTSHALPSAIPSIGQPGWFMESTNHSVPTVSPPPPDAEVGDLLLFVVTWSDYRNAEFSSPDTTFIADDSGDNGLSMGLFAVVHTGATGYSFTQQFVVTAVCTVTSFRILGGGSAGVASVGVPSFAELGTSSSEVIPGVTTTAPNSLALGFTQRHSDSTWPVDVDPPFYHVWQMGQAASNQYGSPNIFTQEMPVAGPTGDAGVHGSFLSFGRGFIVEIKK